MKAKKSYDKGGKMKQGASKRPQPRSNLSGQPTTRQELMQQHREERKSRFQNMTKKEMDKYRKPVNRFDKGGKVTGAQTKKQASPNSTGMGESNELRKKREQAQLERSLRESRRAKRINESEARRAKARPDYKPKKKLDERLLDDSFYGPRSGPQLLTAKKLKRNDVTKLEMTSPKKEIKKSTAKIPVPAKKRRLRLRRRK